MYKLAALKLGGAKGKSFAKNQVFGLRVNHALSAAERY